jgi:hypothetical protein
MRDGRWIASCSVPCRAAQELLKTLDARGNVVCFLAPNHGAQVQVALERLRPEQSLIVALPQIDTLWLMLACCDLAAAIRAKRLWWVCGSDWPDQLARLLVDQPGLPTPQQFIRTAILGEEASRALIEQAQRVFAAENQRRALASQECVGRWERRTTATGRVCVVAGSRFRLWADDGLALAGALNARVPNPQAPIPKSDAGGARLSRFDWLDVDDPCRASGLALARAAESCDGVVIANAGRGDLPAAIAPSMPLITWLTAPRIPNSANAGPRDALLLADPSWMSLAQQAGWDRRRLAVATRPCLVNQQAPAVNGQQSTSTLLTIIADTLDVARAPEFAYSSHRLLWENIAAELLRNPFELGADVSRYLAQRMERLNISGAPLDPALFIERLIVPAWQQGIARFLLANGIALRLFGLGWDQLDGLAGLAAGPITDPEQLAQALAGARVLLHIWPFAGAHAIDVMGRPVIRALGLRPESLLGTARNALLRPPPFQPPASPALSADHIVSLLTV